MRLVACLGIFCCTAAVLIASIALLPYIQHNTAFSGLRNDLRRRTGLAESRARRASRAAAPLDWATFSRNQTRHAGARVLLRNADFAHGTLVVRESCVLELTEDVTFCPNADINGRVRRPEQNAEYPLRSGFQLNFFAAIAITGTDVVLDGRHHVLKQCELHASMQRFYAHVELASSAFISGEGPVAFGPHFQAGRGIVIADVHFGRSAHFAVAGNGNEDVELRNLHITDYEVAAFKLNGVRNAWVHNVTATGHFTRVPVNAEFSQATFVLQFMERFLGRDSVHDAAYTRLKALHDSAVADIRAFDQIDRVAHPEAHALFASQSGIQTGGTVYGFVITDLGAAVGPIQMEHTADTASQRVLVEDVRVNGTHSHTVEFVSLVDEDGEFVHGPAGELVDLLRVKQQYGSMRNDPLVYAMVRYAALYDALGTKERRGAGRPNMPPVFRAWVEAGGLFDASFAALRRDGPFSIGCNTDGMGHVNKGLMAMRIQSSDQVYLFNVDLGDSVSTGPPAFVGGSAWLGVDVDPVAYTGQNADGGHPLQFPMVGYHGNDVHAVAISSSYDVQWENLRVGRVESAHGTAVGLERFEAV